MKRSAFDPKNNKPAPNNFQIDWKLDLEPELSPSDLYKELMAVCCNEDDSPPSFLLFASFTNFLANLLQLSSEWHVCANMELQRKIQFTGLKHSFTRLLIETARSFALRNVPKTHAGAELHPLAPPAPTVQRLVRQLTLTREISLNRAGSGGSGGPPALQRTNSGSQGGRPQLARANSRTMQGPDVPLTAAGQDSALPQVAEAEVQASGVGRLTAVSYATRFAQLPSWESMTHPVAYFVRNEKGGVIGCNVLSLNKDFLGTFIDGALQRTLKLQGIQLDKDWSTATHEDAMKCVYNIQGGRARGHVYNITGPAEYVVTVDNLIKLLSIQQRLKYALPVILMGETGCGKTALVRFLAKTLEIPLLTLDVHGGISEVDIVGFMDKALLLASELQGEDGVLVFFDEINAANCMALFNSLIVDRVHRGRRLPDNVRIVSCCNPYRLRQNKELEDMALTYDSGEGGDASGITDPMKNLVYRVHPLPESMVDVLTDFGALTEKSESIYIRAILAKELLPPKTLEDEKRAKAEAAKKAKVGVTRPMAPQGQQQQQASQPAEDDSDYDFFISAFRDLLCASQTFVREANGGERSVVSMRDVARAVRVCKWFLTYYARLKGVTSPVTQTMDNAKQLSHGVSSPAVRISVEQAMRPHLRKAVLLTMGYCYHARLAREQRHDYRQRLCETFSQVKAKQPKIDWLEFSSESALDKELVEVQYEFVSQMDLGEDIALNEALRENLFMLMVSIMNQIPILVVGKPGCSKSLAMDILKSNLNGEVSKKEFFRSMPAVEVFAYQCSPLSTPEAILYAFESARKSNIGNTKTIVCVLLDEIGLAEASPHLPLKVLHRELEHLEGIACVGISNWALDAAKMNRCVMLYRPPPTVRDLQATAEGMAGGSANLKGYLHSLAVAFEETYRTQQQRDFWGMREFYSTIRALKVELRKQAAEGREAAMEPQMVMKAVLRNFGGRPTEETQAIVERFFENVGMSSQGVVQLTKEELICQNQTESDARHAMLLTRNNAALRLLFETSLLKHESAEVMFGGTFPGDQSDVFVAMNLQRVKTFMQQPICLVMVHCDALYESLYDLLNQHYMEFAGQRYVRIAHGSMSKQCPIHKLFRIIVVVEEHDAYYKLPAPLLNRFEKQVFRRQDLMTAADNALLASVMQFWETLLGDGAKSTVLARQVIAGFHTDLLASLVFALRRSRPADTSAEDLLAEARSMLTWVFTPEAVCMLAAQQKRQGNVSFDITEEYFKKQSHIDLPSYLDRLLGSKELWTDAAGAQTMVMTFSPLSGANLETQLADQLKAPVSKLTCKEVMLHELSSSQDLEKELNKFYQIATMDSCNLMIIHADTTASSARMIEYSRFLCEKSRIDFLKSADTSKQGSVNVLIVVHLERGYSGFSFDFDSQWRFVFLDSIEAAGMNKEAGGLPALGEMLHTPLLQVFEGCDFLMLLKRTFREAFSRLVYPQRRSSGDLQAQVGEFLSRLEDEEFIELTRSWIVHVLSTTQKTALASFKVGATAAAQSAQLPGAASMIGEDAEWYADVAAAAQDLMLAGTLRNALHRRILTMITSLLAVFMSHLDRNGGYSLLCNEVKRKYWLMLVEPTLSSPVSVYLLLEQTVAVKEHMTSARKVATDAHTPEEPFQSRFPFSWFIFKTVESLQPAIKNLPPMEQMKALQVSYKLTPLHAAGLDPRLPGDLLEDYLADFTAMQLQALPLIDRSKQQELMKAVFLRAKGALESLLEIHLLFWLYDKQVRFCCGLVNAVPQALKPSTQLMQEAPLEELNVRLLLVGHRLLIDELQALPEADAAGESVQAQYRAWLNRKMHVNALTDDFTNEQIASSSNSPLLRELKADAEPRLETLAFWVRYVAHPMKLDLAVTAKFVASLPPGEIRQTPVFGTILKAVDSARHACAPADQDAALDFGRCFVEAWILEVCLRDQAAAQYMELFLVRLCCHLSASLPVRLNASIAEGVEAISPKDFNSQLSLSPKDGSGAPEAQRAVAPLAQLGDICIARLPSFTLALLRKLVRGCSGEVQKQVLHCMQELMEKFEAEHGHNDGTFSRDYVVVREEGSAELLSRAGGPPNWPQIRLEMLGDRKGPERALWYMGNVRWMLAQYAWELSQKNPGVGLLEDMEQKVGALLLEFDGNDAAMSRALRMYVMKHIERNKGVTFLRTALAEEPVALRPWVVSWRSKSDLIFEKFIGSAKVPTWNPFKDMDVHPEFDAAKKALGACMQSHSVARLEALFQQKPKDEAHRRRVVGNLLLALVADPGMIAPLEEVGGVPMPWRKALEDWLRTSEALPATPAERNLLRVFAGDHSVLEGLGEVLSDVLMRVFQVKGGKKMEALFVFAYLGHLAGSVIAASPTSLLANLRSLMLEPRSLFDDGKPTYLPTMDEDIRHRIQRAFGRDIGYSMANHWYKCKSCGNRFFIGECSKPMQEAPCPGCGAIVGGKSHSPTAMTEQDDSDDSSPWGFTLPRFAEDEKHLFFRDVQPVPGRAMRLLVNSSMICGLAALSPQSTANDRRVYDSLVNQSSTCRMHTSEESTYIFDHFVQDWDLLAQALKSHSEGLSIGMHVLLDTMTNKVDTVVKKKKRSLAVGHMDQAGSSGIAGNGQWHILPNLRVRAEWEETMDEKYLAKWIETYEDCVADHQKKWSSQEDASGPLIAEIRETADPATFATERRKQEMPQVLAYRASVTLGELQRRLPQAKKHHDLSVLTQVMRQQILETVKSLRTLPGQFKWHNLVLSRFGGRITKTEARALTVRQALENQPAIDRPQWETAYGQLENAWQVAFPAAAAEGYECLQIPDMLKTVFITKDTAMEFAIATDTDCGILPLVLTQWLVEQHNGLVQAAALSGGYPPRKVSSSLCGHHDTIQFDKDALVRYIRDRCVTHGQGGRLEIDFLELERHLRHQFAKPEIALHMGLFQWLGDQDASFTNELMAVVPQRDLDLEVVARLKAEIRTPVQAAQCLQKLQMAATFIINSKEALVASTLGKMKLVDYMEQVLSEPGESLPSATARAEVHIHHVDAFVKLVKGVIYQDPMDALPGIYKAPLPPALEAGLQAAIMHEGLRGKLAMICEIMERGVEDFTSGTNAPSTPMVGWVANFIDYREGDGPCARLVEQVFPAGLEMQHWEASYRVLKAAA
eukprot:TRINITY_DN22233_c0_g2_i1.p1 TRINITY_DN22233_c0_g2~~TRINITY_DN22233_c0_g2_i1.p1  ORF type:complete len:3205 (-),score=983.73 TRINITY_DN22233_c0_g2_i1:80-9475(-)